MARCPFATWRPLPENAYQAKIDPTQAILHSADDGHGRTSLFGYFGREDITAESHFYIYLDGEIEQYLDTTVRGDANRYANVRAISIETEDDGQEIPWSDAQVASILRLLNWLCDTHPKILRQQCPAWDKPGIGWHAMWGAPSEWTPAVGKTCPRAIRVPQAIDIIAQVAAPPAPTPVLKENYEEMVIQRRVKPNQRLLFLGGKLFLGHDDNVTLKEGTPTVVVNDATWNRIIAAHGPVIQ